jgi:hypothetical protein
MKTETFLKIKSKLDFAVPSLHLSLRATQTWRKTKLNGRGIETKRQNLKNLPPPLLVSSEVNPLFLSP